MYPQFFIPFLLISFRFNIVWIQIFLSFFAIFSTPNLSKLASSKFHWYSFSKSPQRIFDLFNLEKNSIFWGKCYHLFTLKLEIYPSCLFWRVICNAGKFTLFGWEMRALWSTFTCRETADGSVEGFYGVKEKYLGWC